jgi:hypothetical protein
LTNIYIYFKLTTKSLGFVISGEKFQPSQKQDLSLSQSCILPDQDKINIIPVKFASNKPSSFRGDDNNVNLNNEDRQIEKAQQT